MVNDDTPFRRTAWMTNDVSKASKKWTRYGKKRRSCVAYSDVVFGSKRLNVWSYYLQNRVV